MRVRLYALVLCVQESKQDGETPAIPAEDRFGQRI